MIFLKLICVENKLVCLDDVILIFRDGYCKYNFYWGVIIFLNLVKF